MSSLLVINSHLFPALYNIIVRWQSLAMGIQERGDVAVVTCPGKKQGSGSHSQWAGTWERGEVVAVIHSGWAQGGRSGREERGVAVDERERRGRIKQNNYQSVT